MFPMAIKSLAAPQIDYIVKNLYIRVMHSKTITEKFQYKKGIEIPLPKFIGINSQHS